MRRPRPRVPPRVRTSRHPPGQRLRRPTKPSAPPLAPIGRRERSQLARGRKAIDARLDLHGMTQERAHRRLVAFLQGASADGATFVLVITGKGRASVLEGERGVLRRQVPLWLALPDLRSLVVGFEEAGIGHGGEGALYVRLRRARIALQNKPAEIGVLGEVADMLVDIGGVDRMVSPFLSGAAKEISSSTRSITVCRRRAPMFSTVELT